MVKFKKIIIFGIFIIELFCSLTWARPLKKQTFGQLIFYYAPDDSLLVQQLIKKINRPWAKIEALFHEALMIPVSVRITKSNVEFMDYLHNQIPEWSQAVAIPAQRMVVLKLADAEQIKRSPQILVHELVHVLVFDYLQGRTIPTWLNEGMADYFSEGGLSLEKKITLAEAIVKKNVMDLAAIDSLWRMGTAKARLAYIEAQSAVEFMVNQFGEPKLLLLLKNIRSQRSFPQAFQNTFGFDLLDFEIHWNEYIKQKYRWLVLLKFEELVFAFSGILFLIVVIVIYFRNKRKLKELTVEDEENFDDGGD